MINCPNREELEIAKKRYPILPEGELNKAEVKQLAKAYATLKKKGVDPTQDPALIGFHL